MFFMRLIDRRVPELAMIYFLILFPEQYLDGNAWLFLNTRKKR